ncbi:SPOR domain-containing protein [Sphingorhabdus arenilitoris]|uniref:SPOR domain-containing protein n=1 Tax=Sphingorhabdus arenilitoris TaxID=1490041 RepID=A0ABV8RFS3_9SPHN
MSDTNNDGLNLDDPDRLPWLETADGYEYDDGASPLKVAGLVLGGLALLALIVGGIYWMQRNQTGGVDGGNGELIAAQEGDYKVRPEDAGGKSFEGEGDAAFAASEGKKTASTVSTAKPEAAAPVPAPAAPGANAPIAAGSSFVQMGAFSDAASADKAWAALGKRFAFLSGVNKRIAEGSGEGGRKVFRLQAVASDAAAAQQLCAKLKAAGEGCLIVK